MPAAYCDDLTFKRTWERYGGNIEKVKEDLGYSTARNVYKVRREVQRRLGITLPAEKDFSKANFPEFLNIPIERKKEYVIAIGSDKHNIPGDTPQAFKAFLHLLENIKPDIILINGDWFDFQSIARFHRIGWQQNPALSEELECGLADLEQIERASPRSKRIFTLGNHDMRFDGKLSNCLPEFENIHGSSLEHHLKKWQVGMSATFNDFFIVKHRWHGGIHANYNNVLRGGRDIATGHTHKLNIRPWTDYNGTRYGIETGTLSDLYDESFLYTESNAVDWQPGCAVVTVSDNIIIPTVCPIVIDKNHRRQGKLHYQGVWYG